jgi:hypothetical protein
MVRCHERSFVPTASFTATQKAKDFSPFARCIISPLTLFGRAFAMIE